MTVTLFDRGALGQGTSRVAAGMLAPVSEADAGEPALLRCRARLSAARWPTFAAELERGSGLDAGPADDAARSSSRATRDDVAWLDRERELRERLGVPVARLLGSDARRLEPALAPERARGARRARRPRGRPALAGRGALRRMRRRRAWGCAPARRSSTQDADGVTLAGGRSARTPGASSSRPAPGRARRCAHSRARSCGCATRRARGCSIASFASGRRRRHAAVRRLHRAARRRPLRGRGDLGGARLRHRRDRRRRARAARRGADARARASTSSSWRRRSPGCVRRRPTTRR